MNRFVWACAAALALSCASVTSGQVSAVDQQAGPMLMAGTTVALRTVEGLTTKGKKLRPGDRFKLEVVEAVPLNGIDVIPAGSPAVGEVTSIRNKGMFGKSGNIEARLLYVRANGRQIRLTGRLGDKGSKNGVGAGVATYFTLVGGLIITGTSADIPAGTPVTGYLDEDTPVVFAGVASAAPMIVPAAAPASVPAAAAEPSAVATLSVPAPASSVANSAAATGTSPQ